MKTKNEITKSDTTTVPMYHLELVRDTASFPYKKFDMENENGAQKAAAEVFHGVLDSSHVEKLAVIYCNAADEMIGVEVIAIGSLDRVGADMSDIFKGAIKANAKTIWLAHNHPGGIGKDKVKASVPDFLFTTKVLETSEILGIPLNDHLVIQSGSHYSIKENMQALSDEAKKVLARRNPLGGLIQILGGEIAADSAVKLMESTPWDRGINPTWIKPACSNPKCTHCKKKKEQV